jgi:hypothetical protein
MQYDFSAKGNKKSTASEKDDVIFSMPHWVHADRTVCFDG